MASNPNKTQNDALRVIVNFHYNPKIEQRLTMRIIGDSLIEIVSQELAVAPETIISIATPHDQFSSNVPDVLIIIESVDSEEPTSLNCLAVKKAIYAAVHTGVDWATDGIPPGFSTKVHQRRNKELEKV